MGKSKFGKLFIKITIVALLILKAPLSGAFQNNYIKEELSRVSFSLETEVWIKAKTVRVVVGISMLGKESELLNMKGEALKELEKVLETEWKITGYRRQKDSSGLIRLNLRVETRIKENRLAGIFGKIKELSREGMQFRIVNLDFSPSVEEIEKAKSRGRAKIYGMVLNEAKSISKIYGKEFNIIKIEFFDFKNQQWSGRRLGALKAQPMEMAEREPPKLKQIPIIREKKVVIKARVVLMAGEKGTQKPQK